MIRFLLVLLAFVSALLAFIFQETLLFVASGFLLLVSVVLVLLQVRDQLRKKRRLKLSSDITPDDELRARGILAVRPKNGAPGAEEEVAADEAPTDFDSYAPAELKTAAKADHTTPQATPEELRSLGIVEIRAKEPAQKSLFEQSAESGDGSRQPASPNTQESVPDQPDVPAEPVNEGCGIERGSVEDLIQQALTDQSTGSQRRRVEVDAHLPALQNTLGAHTACLLDVDTDTFVYRLRSVVSRGAVDDAGTEYPFSGFFLSDLLAETSVLTLGEGGLDIEQTGIVRHANGLKKLVAAPVMRDGLPAAFFVAAFESDVDESCRDAVTSAAGFFSSLYALQGNEPQAADSPLASATRGRSPLRLVKSNPRSVQRKIIAEEMDAARGKARPLALALVCLDSGEEIARSDETTIHEVEAWMRDCLEAVTPDGRVEYFGELGYGILQTRDVTDVEGWVRRAQTVFAETSGPVAAFPVVGVAMLSEEHRGPDDLQADAFKALRAAYECGDSTILVG